MSKRPDRLEQLRRIQSEQGAIRTVSDVPKLAEQKPEPTQAPVSPSEAGVSEQIEPLQGPADAPNGAVGEGSRAAATAPEQVARPVPKPASTLPAAPDGTPMARLSTIIPDELHHQTKMAASRRRLRVQDVVRMALEDWLAAHGSAEK